MDLPIDTLPADPIEDAFRGNRLLATLSDEERKLLAPYMEPLELQPGDAVLNAGDLVQHSVFPYDQLVVSLIVELSGGRSVEVASIGKEGAIGGIVSAGNAPAFTHGVVGMRGKAVAVPIPVLQQAKQASSHLNNLFCRYADFLLAQVMQSVACNAFHALEARCCRWLLTAQDRAGGEEIPLTQEYLAEMLGVQRTTVSAVARSLQDHGLIRYRRGSIQILDRDQVERRACECYGNVEAHFREVLPEVRPQKILDASAS